MSDKHIAKKDYPYFKDIIHYAVCEFIAPVQIVRKSDVECKCIIFYADMTTHDLYRHLGMPTSFKIMVACLRIRGYQFSAPILF